MQLIQRVREIAKVDLNHRYIAVLIGTQMVLEQSYSRESSIS